MIQPVLLNMWTLSQHGLSGKRLKAILTTLNPNGTNILASKFRANVNAEFLTQAKLPLIVIDNEIKGTSIIQKNFNVVKKKKYIIWFLEKDKPGNTDDATNGIQDAMEILADKTAQQIYLLSNVIETGGNQKYNIQPIFHAFSKDLSGVFLEIDVEYNNVISCS